MVSLPSVASLLLAFVALSLHSSCHGSPSSYPSSLMEDRLFRHTDLFAPEDNDSSAASDEGSMLDVSVEGQQRAEMAKRRKGPTLSVVNPLEILRQRLMLDLARRRIHENQQQIEANSLYLENIGKRAFHP